MADLKTLRDRATDYCLGDDLTVGEMHDICQAYLDLLNAAPQEPSTAIPVSGSTTPAAAAPAYVWAVENRTSFLLFASEEAARKYVSVFSASVSGGMAIAKLAVVT